MGSRTARCGVRRRDAFTLIELLVVTAILAVLTAAVGATLAAGLRVWDRSGDFDRYERDICLGMEVFARDLANAVRFGPIPFSGTGDRLSFAVRSSFPGAHGGQVCLGTVEYFCDPVAGALRRSVWPFPSEPASAPETLVPAIQTVDLDYGFAAEHTRRFDWREEATNMPVAVRITLTAFSEGGDPGRVRSRTVLVPIARR